MINIEDHFSLNRTLLLTVGLWPYQNSKLARFHFICFFSILMTVIIFQLTTFLTSKCTIDLIIKVLSSAVGFTCLAIKYNSFSVNSEAVKYLMEQLQCICDNLKDNNEIAIVERYGNYAKRCTIILTMLVICSVSVCMTAQLWPSFLDFILSKNESRPRRLQFMTEYFVDQEKYFYLLLLHINVAICIALVVSVATGAILLAYLQYACGMFQIASYRIENAMQIHTLHSIILLSENMVYKRIICAIDIHRKAMMFSEYLMSKFEITLMFLIALGVITLSLNIHRTFQLASSRHIEDASICVTIGSIALLYMFLANFIGQEIMDHNDHVFVTVYKIQWYTASLKIQKMILFLLQRGNKIFGLNVGGVLLSSLECFATLVNASISYVTLMYSAGLVSEEGIN